MELYVYIVCIVLLASLIQSSLGFGFAIIAMMVFPLTFSIPDSMFLITVNSIVMVSFISLRYRKFIDFKILFLPLLLSLIGNYVSLTHLLRMDRKVSLTILGAMLIVFSVYFLIFSNKIKLPKTHLSAAIAGTLSGLMSGFVNIPGPPMVLYYSTVTTKKETYMGTLQSFFLVNAIFKTLFLLKNFQVSQTIYNVLPGTILMTIIGTLIGNIILKKIAIDYFKKVIYVVMAFLGVYYIL